MTLGMRHHGDLDAVPGLIDLAVNVRPGTPPTWLRERLADVDLARYPDQRDALAAVAARHERDSREVLLTAGAAEAFVLLTRTLTPRRAVVVHPQFTEPELALTAAGHPVRRLVLAPPFAFDPARVPDDADLVIIGNPTNPTSVLHSASAIRSLCRPGRIVVVDEAFADCVPGERESLAGEAGVVVVRSLTKTWGLAGLRVGYVLAPAPLVERLRAAQPHWPVSSPALAACVACSTAEAQADAQAWASALAGRRAHLTQLLRTVPGVSVGPGSASFLLVRADRPGLWTPLRAKGFAVRRGDTFPGLDTHWFRIAVRDEPTSTAFVEALHELA
ncbi:MAG TPA: Rv2231c family pyridoxal phosphate-dependent protein CobC [Jatrophihabitantaceae bacterium]|jgi:histidinol-phosphate aminotransferase|nr:Rv2231c family pyridoxal phosphate-dependent protein CobC [Jatrophihabitantaceae bacterium]